MSSVKGNISVPLTPITACCVGVDQKLQMRLGEMELELHTARDEALRQERNVQTLSDTVVSKETEVSRMAGL